MDVLSNNSDFPFTPDSLRKLAEIQGSRKPSSEPTEFHVHRLSARLSPETIDSIVRRYEAGQSARSLAQEFEIAPSALLRLLRERSVVVRQEVVTPELEHAMARGYEAGMTVAELKDEYAISHGAVLRALHRAGVEMRAKAPRRKLAEVDPALTPHALARRAADYATGGNYADPLVSPIFADLAGLPPLLIQVGTNEILLDDATRLATQAAQGELELPTGLSPVDAVCDVQDLRSHAGTLPAVRRDQDNSS